jgi:hypothetical protein
MKISPGVFRFFMNLWPPFRGMGIRVARISPAFDDIEVELRYGCRLRRNYVNTQFGGSIYAMTDPFYMLILMQNLGRDYIVWDKAAAVRFLKPGKTALHAHFRLTPEQIADAKAQADANYKFEPTYTVQIKDDNGEVVAEVDKLLYIRRKDRQPRPKAAA